MPRFVGADGTIPRARRAVSGTANVFEQDVTDPRKLAETIRGLSARVAELEAARRPDFAEFELVTSSGDLHELAHGFTSPGVRFLAVDGGGPLGFHMTPVSNTAGVLTLLSHCGGRMVVRVEPTDSPVEATGNTGSTALDTVAGLAVASPFGLVGRAIVPMGDANTALTADQVSRFNIFISGAHTAIRTLSGFPLPASEAGTVARIVHNGTTGGFAVTVSSGAVTINIASGARVIIGCGPSGIFRVGGLNA
jgi:hypothetical protein